ncbi:epoxyqueuosine reductase QueH [Streptococcus oricebi]|uniref:Epoxyqueuosine reductase QueH n=1 Tax=Streptococcus oricebi TaxID=1547447 RepID=A0ABS5B5F2_9STRE|nr:epoxyqueuosine reductase QueH [Streptococcus oricebi]MBP2623711.1 DNA integration/recombination/inversion protein [Streptococcus oricebi]
MIDLAELVSRLNPQQKVNYDRLLEKMIKSWQEEKYRPSILLHTCCAPCLTYSLSYLSQYADVTVYFANPNIHPKAEYQRRALVTQRFIRDFNGTSPYQVQYIEAPYEPEKFFSLVHGWEQEEEGGRRCQLCFHYRLEQTASLALDLGFDYFASVLTLSPHKDAQLINRLGLEIQELYQTRYLPSDFKKRQGYQRSIELCKDYDIYRQCYCGCIFGARDQGVNLAQIKRDAQAFLKEQEGQTDFPDIQFKLIH